jgi:uncharacterized protein YyaL (SSP411 family)
MDWLEWDESAFERARAGGSPVLLFLRASWCRWCRELERQVLDEPRVRALVEERFVAIKVDKDRRPDIDARYSKGGWPTLAFLDDAGELIASDTYLEADELLSRLQLIADYYIENRETIRRRMSEAAESRQVVVADQQRGSTSALSHQMLDWVAASLLATADPLYGGWGHPQKFPHPEALDFALLRWSQTGDDALRQLVLRTLRHMQQGAIYDRVEGGFYRYSTTPDWGTPHYEKMLDSNAQRLRAYLEAHQALGEESFRATAVGILGFLDEVLLDPSTGAFRGSQDADPGYAHVTTREGRLRYGAPACDPTIFANWNAMACSALFKASSVLQNPSHGERALGTLSFLIEKLWDERAGMYHYWDGGYHLPGMLSDQAYTLRALVDAVQHTSSNHFLGVARSLAATTLENLHSSSGAFYDTRYDPGARGSLRQRNCSILENAVLAEALLRLSHLTGEDDYADTARETLAAFANEFKRYGHYVAGYARAVDYVLNPPVHVTIVGNPLAEDTKTLRQAALTPYIASRVVQVIDPSEDAEMLKSLGLPAPRRGPLGEVRAHAYVHRGKESFADTGTPARLPILLTRIERGP